MQIYTQHTKASLVPSARGRGQAGGTVGGVRTKIDLSLMSFPLSLSGHSAPDEILGGEALLHEHQPGPGELQQVLSSP